MDEILPVLTWIPRSSSRHIWIPSRLAWPHVEQDQDCSFYLRYPFGSFLLWSEYPFHRLLPSRLQRVERLARNIPLSTQLAYMSILSLMDNHAARQIHLLRYWDTMMGMHWFLLARIVSFSYLTSSRRVFATFPHTVKSSYAPFDTCRTFLIDGQ